MKLSFDCFKSIVFRNYSTKKNQWNKGLCPFEEDSEFFKVQNIRKSSQSKEECRIHHQWEMTLAIFKDSS